jgi:hypothetical protein
MDSARGLEMFVVALSPKYRARSVGVASVSMRSSDSFSGAAPSASTRAASMKLA